MKNQYNDFVKLTDVKQIVQDVTLPLLEAMHLRESEAMKATSTINILSQEIKKIRTETRQAMLLRGNILSINKHTNKIDQQYELCNDQLKNMDDIIDYKVVKVAKQQELQQREHNELFEIQEKRNERVLALYEQFSTHQTEVNDQLSGFKNEINLKLVNQDAKLKHVHEYKTAMQLAVDTAKGQMSELWTKCTEEIMDKLEVQEMRMQQIEMRHMKLIDFEKRFVEFQKKFAETGR